VSKCRFVLTPATACTECVEYDLTPCCRPVHGDAAPDGIDLTVIKKKLARNVVEMNDTRTQLVPVRR